MKSKYFEIYLPIYPCLILVAIRPRKNKMQRLLKGHLLKRTRKPFMQSGDWDLRDVNKFGRFMHFYEERTSLIIMRDFPEGATDIGRVTHEVYHAIATMGQNLGIKQVEETEEIFAYAMQHVMERIYQEIGK